jgi:hypothetical protein
MNNPVEVWGGRTASSTSDARLSAVPLSNRGKSIKEEIKALAGEGAQFIHEDGVARLNVAIFAEQLAVHVCFPLSIPYLYFKYGPQAPRNQLLWGPAQSWIFLVVSHLFWMLPIVYLCWRPELNEGGISDAEFSAVIFGGLVYRSVIAIKYGSLTKKEYVRYLLEDDPKVARHKRLLQFCSSLRVLMCGHTEGGRPCEHWRHAKRHALDLRAGLI